MGGSFHKSSGERAWQGLAVSFTVIFWSVLMDPYSWDPQSPKLPLALLAFGSILCISSRRRELYLHPLDPVILGGGLTLLGLGLVSPYPHAAQFRLTQGLLWMGAYLIGRFGILSQGTLERTLTWGGVILIVTALIQRTTGIWVRPDALGEGGHKAFELVSGLTNPDYLAAWLLFVIPILVVSRRFVLLALVTLGLVLTYSRTAWLALVLAFFIHPIVPGQRRWTVPFLLLALLVVPILLGGQGLSKLSSSQTLKKRLLLYESSLRLSLEKPWMGWGPGSFPIVYPTQRNPTTREGETPFITEFAHNILLQTSVEGGLVGSSILLAFLIVASILIIGRTHPGERALGLGLTAFFLHNLGSVSALIDTTSSVAALILGVLVNRSQSSGEMRLSSPFLLIFPGMVLLATVSGAVSRHEAFAMAGRNRSNPRVLSRACQIYPQHPGLRYCLGGVLAQQGKLPLALTHYLLLEGLEPWYGRIHFNRGRLSLDCGFKRQARIQLESALSLEPTSYRCLYSLAELSYLEKDQKSCLCLLRKCLALAPPREVAEKVRSLLRVITSPEMPR